METQPKVRLLLRRTKSSGWEAWGIVPDNGEWGRLAASGDLQEVLRAVRVKTGSDYVAPPLKPIVSN